MQSKISHLDINVSNYREAQGKNIKEIAICFYAFCMNLLPAN